MTRPLTVLHSLPRVRPTTNPYLVMLRERLRSLDGLDFVDFGYRRALSARYDVFHVHWPETLLGGGSGPLRTTARQLLLVLFLLRMTLRRTPVVRTQHNVEPPEGLRRHEYLLLAWFDRLTVLRIHLNEHTASRPGEATVLIPHGHYRDWFAAYPHRDAVPGRLGYAGLIRRYKGVENLVAAFQALPDAAAGRPLSLHVAGRPSSEELALALRAAAVEDPRITLDLTFLSEGDFAAVLTGAELVVLPYRFMHNSGGVLASLSLDRPVLVPDNEVNRSLAAEVGPGWVHTYADELGPDDLVRALAATGPAGPPRSEQPDLGRRGWAEAGEAHLLAYRTALARRRRQPPPVPGGTTEATPARSPATTRGQL